MPKIFIEYLGNSVQVPYGETVGGRDLTCGLRFNDPAVSRRHLRLVRRRDDVFIEDLGSSNGTVVNEQTLAGARRLEHGDTIQLGTRRLTIHVVTGERDAEPSTLNLKDLSQVPLASLRRGKTALQPTVPPPAAEGHQRCPGCAAPVADGGHSPVLRRRHDRQPIELRLIYTSDQLEVEATTRDLSASGVFVCSTVLDPIGTPCRLSILIGGGPPLQLRGVVRRVVETVGTKPVGLGIEFADVGPVQRAWLDAVSPRGAPPLAAAVDATAQLDRDDA